MEMMESIRKKGKTPSGIDVLLEQELQAIGSGADPSEEQSEP